MNAIDEFEALFKSRGYLSPKLIDTIILEMGVRDYVVKQDCTTRSYESGIRFEIFFDTFVRMVAIDEEQIQHPTLKCLSNGIFNFDGMRVSPNAMKVLRWQDT